MGRNRTKQRPEAETIAEFWQWWTTARDGVAAAIANGTVRTYVDDLGGRVEAIHPDLQWELAPGGAGSEHAVVVTAGGHAETRAPAARWLAAAPPADATWSYRSQRAADPDTFTATIELDGHKLELEQIRYDLTVDRPARQVDVVCYHPGFAGLPDEVAGQVTFLTLDWTLGESDAAVWVGEVAWTADAPARPRTWQDLRHAVTAIAEDEDDSWVLMEAELPGGVPLLAAAASPLRPARWPRFDLHVPVTLPFRAANEAGMPERDALEALRRFEDELTAAVAADGALVAHETSRGRRTLHYYVDAQSGARAALEARLDGWPAGRPVAEPNLDPAFDGVAHLMP